VVFIEETTSEKEKKGRKKGFLRRKKHLKQGVEEGKRCVTSNILNS